jgi:hypothetical protein
MAPFHGLIETTAAAGSILRVSVERIACWASRCQRGSIVV